METTQSALSERNPRFAPESDNRAVKILARTMYKDLVSNGLERDQILAIASELISHVTQELRGAPEEQGRSRGAA